MKQKEQYLTVPNGNSVLKNLDDTVKKIAVIGGGWYGCHIALVLSAEGYHVTIFESNDNIFEGISGKFGIRLHTGPHYPRSLKTRESCQQGYTEFENTYSDLIIPHDYAVYGLGTLDANGEQSKVDVETFRKVGKEVKNSEEIDLKEWGYDNLHMAFNTDEPSILLGEGLREKFTKDLRKAAVDVRYNFNVRTLTKQEDGKITVVGDYIAKNFDFVINTTSYQALLPTQPLPFDLDIVYQPCLALVYKDRLPSSKPFSFIVMDGWFPCIMPSVENRKESNHREYIVTHGKYTIMGSYTKLSDANDCLAKIDESFIEKHVQSNCETEMRRFWPEFGANLPNSEKPRFEYIDYKGAVIAKVKTNREFRSAITFAQENVIYVIPGKVSNVFDAGRETLALINSRNVLQKGNYQYVENGVLHSAINEITEHVDPRRNTCTLQTYEELSSKLDGQNGELFTAHGSDKLSSNTSLDFQELSSILSSKLNKQLNDSESETVKNYNSKVSFWNNSQNYNYYNPNSVSVSVTPSL